MARFKPGDKVVTNGKIPYVYTIRTVNEKSTGTFYVMKEKKGITFEESYLAPTKTIDYEKPKKYNNGKPMMSLVRPEFINAVAEVLTYGFEKYDEKRGDIQNYLKGDGFHYSEIYDSLQRHLNEWFQGVSKDPETGKNHLAHAAANIMFLLTYELTEKGVDDRIVLEGVAIETETTEKNSKKRSEGRHDTKTKESDRSSEGSDQATEEAT